ncbi:hypothetical protein GLAREA_05324 [Glarea lozoyensis ATCC 20868]|uniref:Uncharacterized protein n=1 Tax=Glarea lozoyensis (strain ATCC 20868 / MF5171) TaxID=1116229 RepID=S3DVL1_GLAL2|nr:uncharacterized protein GLAREA_05324 [Glarea lozoyensis ATCC 20868]EPE35986.1 hypothetical protein GLAREA_05324 [Glarea lozoyensis ATCC 20868]
MPSGGRRKTIVNPQECEDGIEGIERRLVLLLLAVRDKGVLIIVCCGLLLRMLTPRELSKYVSRNAERLMILLMKAVVLLQTALPRKLTAEDFRSCPNMFRRMRQQSLMVLVVKARVMLWDCCQTADGQIVIQYVSQNAPSECPTIVMSSQEYGDGFKAELDGSGCGTRALLEKRFTFAAWNLRGEG